MTQIQQTYKFNPFKKVTRGYKVLDVNLANNSFTADISETPVNIYFPYLNKAALSNYFGDPNILTPGEIAQLIIILMQMDYIIML